MKKIYIEPETLILKITLRDGVLQITSNKSIGGQETETPDEDEVGAREYYIDDNTGTNNRNSIWDNIW